MERSLTADSGGGGPLSLGARFGSSIAQTVGPCWQYPVQAGGPRWMADLTLGRGMGASGGSQRTGLAWSASFDFEQLAGRGKPRARGFTWGCAPPMSTLALASDRPFIGSVYIGGATGLAAKLRILGVPVTAGPCRRGRSVLLYRVVRSWALMP